MERRLALDGITRIGELAGIGEDELAARYGKLGRRLWACARGEDDRPVDPNREARSVSSEITLEEDIADAGRLRAILWKLAKTLARHLRKADLADGGVTLKLKTAGFRTVTRPRRLHTATRSADRMFRVAEALLAREAYGRVFRLIGVGADDLVAGGRDTPAGLFDAGPGEEDLDDVLDALRDRFGDEAIVRGRGLGVRLARQGPSKVE